MGDRGLLMVEIREGMIQKITSIFGSKTTKIKAKLTYKHTMFTTGILEDIGNKFIWHEDNIFTFIINTDVVPDHDTLKIEVYNENIKVGECKMLMSLFLGEDLQGHSNEFVTHTLDLFQLNISKAVGNIKVGTRFIPKPALTTPRSSFWRKDCYQYAPEDQQHVGAPAGPSLQADLDYNEEMNRYMTAFAACTAGLLQLNKSRAVGNCEVGTIFIPKPDVDHHYIEEKLLPEGIQVGHNFDEVINRKVTCPSLPSLVVDQLPPFEMQHVPFVIVAFENNPFKKLKELILLVPSGASQTIGLKGRGGAGKTLLAKMVNNDEDIQQKYGVGSILRITIGQDVSVSSVYKRMQKFLDNSGGFESVFSGRDLEDQRTYLMEAFEKKRALVILDDIWGNFEKNCTMVYWLDICKGDGSTTLITTRDDSILDHVRAMARIEVKSLSIEESWKLFSFHAFQTNIPLSREVEDIAREICNECEGLPLALVVIGGALRGKQDERDWKYALNRLKRSESLTNSDTIDEELFHRLRLSYDLLSDDAKKCFLYFAAFPENYDVPTKMLYSIWQVEELFGSHNIEDILNMGRMNLTTLADRSLIDLDEDGEHAKVHNVLRDLAIHIIREAQSGELASQWHFKLEKVSKILSNIIDDDQEMLPQSDSIQNLINSTMTLLGVQQSSKEVRYGSNDYLQEFEGRVDGSLAGRFNAELMEIQILLSSLESMVFVIGVGLKLDQNQLVLVTLSTRDSSKVVMRKLEKEECEKMTSSGGDFYTIHFDVDNDENEDHIMKRPQISPSTSSESDSTTSAMEFEKYKGVDKIEEDPSMYFAWRFHTFAKLILLLACKESPNVPLPKVKEFLLVWDWKDMKMALGEYEEEWKNIANFDTKLVNKRPTGDEGGSDSRGHHRASNLPSNNKGKAKCSQSGALYGGGSGAGGGGEDGGEDDDGFDHGHHRLLSSSSNSLGENNYSIEVRPGYGCYQKHQNNTSWPYKSIHVFATPVITISFRNCFNHDSKEVHAKLEVNFDLANDSDPSESDLEMNQFAWYHDYYEFSIQCIDDGAAELKVGSGSIYNLEPVKSIVSNTTTRNSKTSVKAFSTELKTSTLLPVQNTTKMSYTRTSPSSSLTIGEMRENLNRETVQGFLPREKFEGGSKPRIGCAFKYAKSKDIESYIHEAFGRLPDMERYLDEDICSSQAQVIEGAFRPLADNKHYYAYSFNCYRRIVGFFWAEITKDISGTRKWKRKFLCKADETSVVNFKHCKKVTCEQRFDVALYINHGMRHVHKLALECPNGIPPLRGGDKHRRVLAADCLKDNNV